MSASDASANPILIAYDGSDHAKSAIAQAGTQLRTPRKAIVLAVWQPLTAIPFWGVPAQMPEAISEGAEHQAQQSAEEGAALAKEAGFDAEALAVEGAVIWDRIVETAKQRGAGIVVIGSHGRSGIKYLTMGSVATAVAQHAKVPVLICRLPGD